MSQNCGSFQAVLIFFLLLTHAEKRAFRQLKALISVEVRKKKEPVERTAILRHVNRLIYVYCIKRTAFFLLK